MSKSRMATHTVFRKMASGRPQRNGVCVPFSRGRVPVRWCRRSAVSDGDAAEAAALGEVVLLVEAEAGFVWRRDVGEKDLDGLPRHCRHEPRSAHPASCSPLNCRIKGTHTVFRKMPWDRRWRNRVCVPFLEVALQPDDVERGVVFDGDAAEAAAFGEAVLAVEAEARLVEGGNVDEQDLDKGDTYRIPEDALGSALAKWGMCPLF